MDVKYLTISTVIFAFLGLSCAEEYANGSVYVTWKLGALTCEEASVQMARVSLYDYDGADPVVVESAECGGMAMQLDEVRPGDYTFVLEGLDTDGCATHQTRRDVEVPEGQVLRLESVALLRRQRPILAQWNFENLLDCQGNGVDQVEIRVVVADLFDETFYSLCEGFQTVIRESIPLGDVTMTVRGIDEDGNGIAGGSASFARDVFLDDPCNDLVELRVPLALCDLLNCE